LYECIILNNKIKHTTKCQIILLITQRQTHFSQELWLSVQTANVRF